MLIDRGKRLKITGDPFRILIVGMEWNVPDHAQKRIKHDPAWLELFLCCGFLCGQCAVQPTDGAVHIPEKTDTRQRFTDTLFVFIGWINADAKKSDFMIIKQLAILTENCQRPAAIWVAAAAEKAQHNIAAPRSIEVKLWVAGGLLRKVRGRVARQQLNVVFCMFAVLSRHRHLLKQAFLIT
jgi:hypothetical protein